MSNSHMNLLKKPLSVNLAIRMGVESWLSELEHSLNSPRPRKDILQGGDQSEANLQRLVWSSPLLSQRLIVPHP